VARLLGRSLGLALLIGIIFELSVGITSESLAQDPFPCDISFALSATSGAVQPGSSTSFSITGTAAGPCSWTFSLSQYTTPTGITASYSPSQVDLSASEAPRPKGGASQNNLSRESGS
jgi:hypothetical protein